MSLAIYLEALGARPSSGTEWILPACPFCGKSGHCYVNAEPEETLDGRTKPAGRWVCFRCGQGSNSFAKLLAELEGISVDEARATIGRWKTAGVQWRRDAFRGDSLPPEVTRKLADAAGAPASTLPPEFESVSKVWPRYLTARGVDRSLARWLNLGVCRSGEFAGRVILPIDCPAGRSFTARAIHPDEALRYKSGPGAGVLLFGWQTIADTSAAVIVEGPFDALRVIAAGFPAVALLGKTLRDPQVTMLKNRRRDLVVMLDPEPDAIRSAALAAERLGARVAILPFGDPGDADPRDIRAALDTAVSPHDALDRASLMFVRNQQ